MHLDPQPGPQTDFLLSEADIVFYGGAAGGGKSWALLLDAMIRALATPGWTGLVIRRLRTDMENEGGIWAEALKLFRDSGAEFNLSRLVVRWPNGSTLTFRQALHNEGLFSGPSYDWIALEEMQEMDIDVLILALTRLRSTKGLRPVVRATMNPKRGHKVVKWLAWYLDQHGEPDRSKSGIVRWFCRRTDTDSFAFGATAAEAEASAGESSGRPLSYAFIPSLLEDNPALDLADPDYRNRIKMQGRTRSAQLGRGNWYVGGDDDGPLARDRWQFVVEPLSPIVKYVRAWDKAATRPSESNRNSPPDYTIGIKLGFDGAGRFYILDMVACREDVDRRDALIAATAKADGHMCQQIHKQGPGDAGKSDVVHTRPLLEQPGGLAPMHVREAKDKLVRATPLIRALELGMRNGAPVNVDNPASEDEWEPRGFVLDAEVRDALGRLVSGSSWLLRPYKDAGSHPETIGELLWEHLDSFPNGDHDDAADALADAFDLGAAGPGRQLSTERRAAQLTRGRR
jgi:phage terminase large subunit-like protein